MLGSGGGPLPGEGWSVGGWSSQNTHLLIKSLSHMGVVPGAPQQLQ